ncbi:hypothetical protein BKA56DRAFT_595992 [Ilyonectria sp. MPI-CAGE-AT-0026]|nr:hypothetical protein BKA56DRAFT_595992 [Ilyonectria sp. MPI-CAGE-AT-0026]
MVIANGSRAVGEVPAEIWSHICSFLHVEEYDQYGFCRKAHPRQEDSVYSDELLQLLVQNDPDPTSILLIGSPRRNPFPDYSSVVGEFQRFYPDATPNPKRDLYSFRLVCKQFSVIAMPFTHQHLCFFLTKKHLQKLDYVAKHPSIPRAVQALRYYATDYAQWDKVHEGGYNYGQDTWINPQDLMAPVVDLSLKPADYAQYCKIHKEQYELKRDDEDVKCFANVFPRFQRLQAIDVLCGPRLLRRNRVRGLEFDHMDLRETSLGVRALETVLSAVADARIRLKSFEAGVFDWNFFNRDRKELDRLFLPLRQLQCLELVMSGQRADWFDIKALARTGVIRELIEPMKELRSLVIKLPPMYLSLASVTAWLSDVIPPFKWEHLIRLSMHDVECTSEDLLSVLLRHKDTLRKLCLGRIVLRSPSWESVLRTIRQDLRLETACLCSELYEIVPVNNDGGNVRNYWTARYSDEHDTLEYKEGKYVLVFNLNEYCCGRGSDDEILTRENAVIYDFQTL